ncbi:MAG: polysaccharide deacetylase family protein [Acidobacteriota bacterium]|nr:polysaccharide deacetylase family protein [Acidobacteriota bacterium]
MIWVFHKVSPADLKPDPVRFYSRGPKLWVKRTLRRVYSELFGYQFRLPSQWWVTDDYFRVKLEEAAAYEVVPLREYTDPSTQLVISFDGIYENVYLFALPLLSDFDYPFELFVTARHVGHHNSFDSLEPLARFANWDQLQAMAARGGRLQYHSRSHPDLTTLDPARLEEEVRPAFACEFFAYPYGRFNSEVVQMVSRHYRGDVAMVGGDGSRFQLRRVEVCHERRLLL